MIKLTQKDWRLFRRLQRKHKVSTEFLRYNLENIEKFIWFETWPRIVIKRYAVRKNNRVFIIYYRLRRVLFDQSNRKMLKRMQQNIKQWSKRVVAWQRTHFGIKEYVEEIVYDEKSEKQSESEVAVSGEVTGSTNEDVIQKMKQQLELLKNGRRPQSLIADEVSATSRNQIVKDDKEEQEEKEHEHEQSCASIEENQKSDSNRVDDVRKQLKEQLMNLKVRRDNTTATRPLDIVTPMEVTESVPLETQPDWQINLESTPEKQLTTQENIQPVKQLDTDEKTEKSHTEPKTPQAEKHKTGLNFLDMLMCKVSGSTINTNLSQTNVNEASKAKDSLPRISSSSSLKEGYQHEHSLDSTDGFLGFDDCERIPGMLMTPIVPHSTKNNKNSVFVSESLNEYMRINDLETNYSIEDDKTVIKSKIFARDMEGLMTPKTKPPPFDMPAVPENLLKFRTVAERKQYLQKFSKNYRLAIINNEASIYRELQRRMRTQKVKSASQMLAQSVNSSMSFTRNGWNAASFINTEFNKYYYQMLDIDHGTYKVRLRGARGNNDEFYKTPYFSRAIKPSRECFDNCTDDRVWQYLKPIKTIAPTTKKLNKHPLPSVFKPCPLSHKTFQKPLDDDTAALLLAGGSMAVVRMPTVELEVFPECGKPLHEIAKRYLQYILPHHDISREWAEFSVSTLQQPNSIKEAEQAAAKSFNNTELRKSFTFVIPYLNDRNHILVRRVVDRSEKLDQSFEKCLEERELVPKTDFSFRQNLDENDEVLITCADVVSDMINTVAISCSENSFIKTDPDGLNVEEITNKTTKSNNKQEHIGQDRQGTSSPNNATSSGTIKKQKKQNSLLMELKRLNATIIDAAVKPGNEKKPCSKDYCQMGCICVSLEDSLPMRQHCGKPKCMLECTCKPSNQSRIMRLETDGRTLTTEDAFMLRRKATARLARMEKEFTSTVVLTENETLLINETNNDKKRRCTKAPKRYEDFTDTEDEQRKNSPKKTALTTIDREKHLAIEVKEVHEPVYVKDTILEQLKHCTVNLVPLPDMDNIAPWCMIHNLYKCFCKGRAVEGKPMIIEKEEINTTIEHDMEQKLEYDYNVVVKPKYTFEKVEKKRKSVSNLDNDEGESKNNVETAKDSKDNEVVKDDTDEDDGWVKEKKRKRKEKFEKLKAKDANEEQEIPKMEEEIEETIEDDYTRYSPTEEKDIDKQKHKRSLHDVRKRFYQLRHDSCRRHIPTPRRMFLYCNRRRRLSVLKYIKENENEKTRLLLNEHIMRSVYYHKIDIENLKKNNKTSDAVKAKPELEEKITSEQPEKSKEKESPSLTERDKKKLLPVDEVVDLLEDEEESHSSNNLIKDKDENTQMIKDRDENTQMTSSSTKSCNSFEKITPDTDSAESTNHFQICSSGGVITVKKFATITDFKNSKEQQNVTAKVTTPTPTPEQAAEKVETLIGGGERELKIPKIASCFSLNANASITKPSTTFTAVSEQQQQQRLDFSSATSVHSVAFKQTHNQQVKNCTDTLAGPSTSSKSVNTSDDIILDFDNENIRDVYNSVIKTMNSLVSKKMQDIDCALQRESHIIPTPNPDILCIMKWCNFLDAFCEGFAYIWQVKMKDITFFVVTIRNIMPLIENAMGVVNITALKPDKMPLIGKMLLQKFRNKETDKLAVVMQGKTTHWVVKGFLKSDPNTACNKPTPETHPSLTKKINVLCSLLVKQRQKEQRKKDKMATQWTSPQMTMATQAMARPTQQVTPKIAQILPTRRLAVPQPSPDRSSMPQQTLNSTIIQNPVLISQLQRPQQPIAPTLPTPTDTRTQTSLDTKQISVKQTELTDSAKVNSRKRKATPKTAPGQLSKMDVYTKMSSNIEFRSVTQNDIDEIFLPEMHKLDHKWLVLDLHNDFSHIFVPDFRDLVSLDRIQKVINFARQKSKIVKLQFFQNAPFDAFVTPKSGKKIYFGPLTMDMKSPTLILLQSVDGQMMLRELYQLQHNIVKKPEERTKAFWLVHVKGQTHFEMNTTAEHSLADNCTVTPINNTEIEPPVVSITNTESNIIHGEDDDDDDEDCMIIDDSFENPESSVSASKGATNLPMNSNCTTNAQITAKSLNINNLQTQSLLNVQNTNTIIKPLNPLNTSVPVLINVPQMSVTNQTLPILTLPPNTIITGLNPTTSSSSTEKSTAPISNTTTNAVVTAIQTAPPDAPYSSTIYITPSSTSSSSTASIVAVTTTNSNATNNTPTLINPVEMSTTNKTTNALRKALEAGSIKRRRISLYCSNNYDKISENLAVDAVIRKILPDNADDIQIKPINTNQEEQQNTTKITPEVVATVGSTRISKISSTDFKSLLNTEKPSRPDNIGTPVTTSTSQTNAPIVFDVNFMDDGDEPTASIVIKPNTSTTNTNATHVTTTTTTKKQVSIIKTATSTPIVSNTNTSLIRGQIMSTSTSGQINSNTSSVNVNSTISANKTAKLPTLFNSPTMQGKSVSPNLTGKTKLTNSLLKKHQLQPNITNKFVSPRPIATELSGPSANNPNTPTTIDNSANRTSFPFRTSVSLKIINSSTNVSSQMTKPITSTATIKLNQNSPTLTVQQVQDILNKPSSSTQTNIQTSSASVMPMRIMPAIKATITSSKTTNNSNVVATTASSSNVATESTISSSSLLPVITSAVSTSSIDSTNSTLTISKVQSFGSTQKLSNNNDKSLQSFIKSQAQIVINDQQSQLESISPKQQQKVPTPPSHIQYGYIVSASYANQKFVAKRVAEEFYVKVPSVGILKLQGLPAVNNYLNKYISKISKDNQNATGVWQFVAASKAVQVQNHQKSLLVRKVKNTNVTSGTTKTKVTVNDTSLDEPILIDD